MSDTSTETDGPADEPESGNWTRRNFLNRVGKAGGAAAVYETMVAMGLINVPPAWAGPPQLAADYGAGKSVAILGAGIGGLTTALLLSRAGYDCRIFEASARAGGRNHSARRGDKVYENSPQHGETVQECQFDEGLYLNLGPGRLPYHHRRVLGYCRDLNVALEPYIMNTTGNLFQADKTKFADPVVYRRVQNDTRGYIAELLAKAITDKALDEELGGRDEAMLKLLVKFGPLGARGHHEEQPAVENDYKYNGSTRDGCGLDPDGNPTPNVYHNCELPEKLSLEALLDSKFWDESFYDPIEFEWQPTLFQPVGGMDQIVEGFLRQVGDLITFDAPVTGIDAGKDGVSVTYQEGGQDRTARFDYCVSNVPCPILEKIENNFGEDPDFLRAVENTEFAASCKVGWQSNTRFWESDDYQIYGGISWTSDIIEQIWYPSNDYFTEKGTLTGAYIHDNPNTGEMHATDFGKFDLAERLRQAKEGGARLHPEFNDGSIVPTELGLSVAWQNVPHQEGAWPNWTESSEHNDYYVRLLMPFNDRFYVVGDQASTLPGWQEGAMMSAEHVVELIGGLKKKEVPEGTRAPNTFKITQGH